MRRSLTLFLALCAIFAASALELGCAGPAALRGRIQGLSQISDDEDQDKKKSDSDSSDSDHGSDSSSDSGDSRHSDSEGDSGSGSGGGSSSDDSSDEGAAFQEPRFTVPGLRNSQPVGQQPLAAGSPTAG